jgi:hypothetical protein
MRAHGDGTATRQERAAFSCQFCCKCSQSTQTRHRRHATARRPLAPPRGTQPPSLSRLPASARCPSSPVHNRSACSLVPLESSFPSTSLPERCVLLLLRRNRTTCFVGPLHLPAPHRCSWLRQRDSALHHIGAGPTWLSLPPDPDSLKSRPSQRGRVAIVRSYPSSSTSSNFEDRTPPRSKNDGGVQ